MASNSVKAKVLNLKDDQHSFVRTGIPRGNPKRFGSDNVIRMARDGRGVAINPEEEKIETEGERQLKVLAKRQLDTEVTAREQLQRKRDFTGATIFKPIGDEVSGKLSLSDFKKAAERDLRIDQLRHYGLSESEIVLKLASEWGEAEDGCDGRDRATSMPGKLQIIEQKIKEKKEHLSKPTTFRGTRHMTRHEQQLEASISHDSDKTKLLSCLLTSKRPDTEFIDPKDPINHLDSIMEDILGGKQERRTESEQETIDRSDPDTEIHSCELTGVACAACSRGDTADTNVNQTSPVYECCEECDQHQRALLKKSGQAYPDWETVPSKMTIKSCLKQQKHRISNDLESDPSGSGDTRTLLGSVESIPEDHILRFRLSVDQIRQLPRFLNYTPGEPSKTLYLKNLSPKATERDLVSLFIRYQKPDSTPIVFKLMSGRMRGQAFVTFDSVETATNALNLINGYQFKDRPIIIQYGKKPHEEQT